MGKNRRRRRAPPQPQITEAHFRLLQAYGRHPLPKRVSKREQRKVWELMCQSANLPHIDREEVVTAWKAFIGGQSEFSSIAINGDIDPNYTTLGVTYGGKLVAAHTTRTLALLRRVLLIFARSYPSRDAFLDAAEDLSKAIADRAFKKPGDT